MLLGSSHSRLNIQSHDMIDSSESSQLILFLNKIVTSQWIWVVCLLLLVKIDKGVVTRLYNPRIDPTLEN